MLPKKLEFLSPEANRSYRNDCTMSGSHRSKTYLYRNRNAACVVTVLRRRPESLTEKTVIRLLDWLFHPELVDEFESSLVLRELRNEQV